MCLLKCHCEQRRMHNTDDNTPSDVVRALDFTPGFVSFVIVCTNAVDARVQIR